MTTKVKTIDGKTYINQELAAELCGVTPPTMINWRKAPNPPPFDPITTMYPAEKLGEWIRKEQPFKKGRGGAYTFMPDLSRVPGADGGDGENLVTKEQEETRLKRLQADKQELDNLERAKSLVPADEVTDAWIDIVSRVKTKLTRIPSALAPLVYGKPDVYAVQETLESGVREALEELSEDWRDAIVDPEDNNGTR